VLRGLRSPGQKWSSSDAQLAIALENYESMIHGPCGQPMYESMDIESDGRWVAHEPMRCHACTAIAERAKAYTNSTAPQALMFSAERRPPEPQNPVEPDLTRP